MSLHNLQIALVEMMHQGSGAAPILDSGNQSDTLTEEEKLWLEKLPKSAGFRVTQDIQRWWRKARLKIASPLTLRALEKLKLYDLLDQYIQETPCITLFFAPEAMSFSEFLDQKEGVPPLVSALARFESALKSAHEYRGIYGEQSLVADKVYVNCEHIEFRMASTAKVVHFPFPPEHLIQNLLVSKPFYSPAKWDKEYRDQSGLVDKAGMNEDEEDYSIVVAPGIKHYWRYINPVEQVILDEGQSGSGFFSDLKEPLEIRVLDRLLHEGIVECG